MTPTPATGRPSGSSGGYALVEAAVATALIATVLLPAGGVALYLLTARSNESHLVALALGQRVMEEALHERAFTSATLRLDGARWVVHRIVVREENRVILVVRVLRRNRPHPLVELMTVRLLS